MEAKDIGPLHFTTKKRAKTGRIVATTAITLAAAEAVTLIVVSRARIGQLRRKGLPALEQRMDRVMRSRQAQGIFADSPQIKAWAEDAQRKLRELVAQTDTAKQEGATTRRPVTQPAARQATDSASSQPASSRS